MKALLYLAVLIGVSSCGFAQAPKSAPVTGPIKTRIENASLKAENASLKIDKIIADANASIDKGKAAFVQANAEFDAAVAEARTELRLPDDATFDLATYSFTVPEKKPDPTAKK